MIKKITAIICASIIFLQTFAPQLMPDSLDVPGSTIHVQAESSGLLAHWNLDESLGAGGESDLSVSDATGNGYYGTLQGSFQRTDGYLGDGAVSFAANAQVQVPYRPAFKALQDAQTMTVSFWFRCQSSKQSRTIFMSRGNHGLKVFLRENQTLHIGLNHTGWTWESVIQDGEWNHFAITVSGMKLTPYLNGIPLGTETYTRSFLSDGDIWFGNVENGDKPLHMDDIRVYSTALTAAQLKTMGTAVKQETTAPSTPTDVTLMSKNDRAASFRWTPSTDNVAVKAYEIFLNDQKYTTSSQSTVSLAGLERDSAYSMTVRAVDLAGNVSPFSVPVRFQTDIRFNKQTSAVGMNLGGISDWSRDIPFIDVFKMARPWGDWSKPNYVYDKDQFGNIRSLPEGVVAHTMVLNGQAGYFKKGRYFVTYEGEGDLQVWQTTDGTKLLESEPGRMLLDVQGNGIWFTLKSVNPDNYIRNIRIIHEEYVELAKTQTFAPDFLERWKDFSVLRFMGMMATNDSLLADWQDRLTPQHFSQAGYNEKVRRGLAVEYMVEMSNVMDADPWFTMPARASDDYIRQFAMYVRDHLEPGRKIYLEYSNETWNRIFEQYHYTVAEGKKLGLTGDNDLEISAKFHAHRAKQMFQIWHDVFGDAERVETIIGGFVAWGDRYMKIILEHEDVYELTDAYAIAPYFGNAYGDKKAEWVKTATRAELIADLYKEVRQTAGTLQQIVAAADTYGVDVVAYEAGQHLSPNYYSATQTDYAKDPLLVAKLNWLNRQPEMYGLYEQYMNQWKQFGGKMHMAFTTISEYTHGGSWGVMEHAGQSRETAHKYRALTDWLRNHPVWWEPLPSAYYELPQTLTAKTIGMNQVELSWSAPPPQDGVSLNGYEVYVDDERFGETSNLSYVISNLLPAKTYRIGVKALYDGGKTSAQLKVNVTTLRDRVAPSVPLNVSVDELTDKQLRLRWDAVVDNVGIQSYEIFVNGKRYAQTPDNFFVLRGLKQNTTYSLFVRAVDWNGNHSPRSTARKIRTLLDQTAPTAPNGLDVTDRLTKHVTVFWRPSTDDVGIVCYEIYVNGQKVAVSTTNGYTFVDPGLLPLNIESVVTIAAVDRAGNRSSFSNELKLTRLGDSLPPSAPDKLSITNVKPTGLVLSWDGAFDQIGIGGYLLYRGSTYVGKLTGTSYTFTNLTPNQAYTFKVRAVDVNGGLSPDSMTIKAVTPAADAPIGPVLTSNVAGKGVQVDVATLNWNINQTAEVSLQVFSATDESVLTVTDKLRVTSGRKRTNVPLKTLAEGTYYLKLSAKSLTGGETTHIHGFRIDRTTPQITGVKVSNEISNISSARAKASVEFALTEPGFVTIDVVTVKGSRVHRLVDNIYIHTTGVQRFGWNGTNAAFRPLADGTYNIRVQAVDRANLRAVSQMAEVKVDHEVPLIANVKLDRERLRMINGNLIKTRFTLAEAATVDVKIVDFSNSSVMTVALGEKAKGNHVFSWDGTDSTRKFMQDGKYLIQLTARDSHKKTFTVKTEWFSIYRDFQ